MIKVIISGSRYANERKIVSSIFEERFGYGCCRLYDCNEEMTDINEVNKQEEINGFIRECDWFIFLATSKNYGRYTALEWQTLVEYLKDKPHDKIITILKCENPEVSILCQNFEDTGEIPFDKLVEIMKNNQYFCDYSYIGNKEDSVKADPFADLKVKIGKEIDLALQKKIILRVLSKSVQDITAKDVFANKYRTETKNGFNDDIYCKRQSVDDELDKKNSGFVVITGAPASGKTRAMYERLKRIRNKNSEARVIVADSYNFNNILESLKTYSGIIEEHANMPRNFTEYIFIFDQITDIVYDAKTKSEFIELVKYAKKFEMLILATSLKSSFDNIKNDIYVPGCEYTVVNIGKIRESEDYYFIKGLRENYKLDNWNEIDVIGECIEGFKGYNKTITKAISDDYENKEYIKAFVKAFNVINLFRKGNLWPLGLVLAVAKKINNELDTKKIKSVMKFFKDNNILHCQNLKNSEYIYTCPELEDEKLFEYDGEKLKIMVSSDWIIKIDNDCVWQYLCTEKYQLDWKNKDAIRNSMSWYFDAFFDNAPFSTLRRIIARSPAVKLAQKGVDMNFVQTFVTGKINEIKIDKGNEVQKNEMNELLAYVLHRSSGLDDFKNTYNEFVGKGFELNELTVAEIMGFAQYKSKVDQKALKTFIKEKGWKFEYKEECNSIYYNRRLIQYMDEFEDVKKLMDKYEIPDDSSSDNKLFDQQNKRHLISNIIEKCRNVEDVKYALDKASKMKVSLDRFFFLTLEETIKNNRFSYDSNKLLGCLCGYFFPDNATDEQNPLSEMSKGVVLYYILGFSDSFCSALQIYSNNKNVLSNEPELDARCISVMLSRTKKTELCYIYNFFFDEDGKLKRKLPQISRNLLLEKLDFNSAMKALEFLFDSSDPDSTPDIYTVISLLKANLEYGKGARYKDYTRNTKHVKNIYQNLLQILSHKKLSGVKRLDKALSLIIQCCNSVKQESYVMDKYVKPKYKEEINEDECKKVDEYFEELNNRQEIVISQIKRNDFTNTKEIKEKIIKVMEYSFRFGLVEEDLINCFLGKLYNLYVNKKIEYDEYKRCRDDMSEYLDFLPCNKRKKIDCIIKGEYFYQAYYRVYPEKNYC